MNKTTILKYYLRRFKKTYEPLLIIYIIAPYGYGGFCQPKNEISEGTVVDADDLIAEVIHEANSPWQKNEAKLVALPKEQR